MSTTLAPHQARAIDSVLSRRNLLVEYATGTGKTRILLESAAAFREALTGDVLILVPNALLDQTRDEIAKWLPPEQARHFVVLDSTMPIKLRASVLRHGSGGIYVLSHEALSFDEIVAALVKREWSAILVDELTRFARWSKRTRALLRLGKLAGRRYGFAGMLLAKGPRGAWYQLRFLDPGWAEVPSKQAFETEYLLMGGYAGREVLGVRPEKVAALNALLDRRRITCGLAEVRDLPERTTTVHRVDLHGKQRAAYDTLRNTLVLELATLSDEQFRLEVSSYVARIQRLQEIAAGFARNEAGDVAMLPSAKTSELLEIVGDGVPTIVWTWWRPEHAAVLAAVRAEGISATDDPEAFKRGEAEVLVLQLARGGYGLNLERAQRMVYHSLPWDLELFLQSLERNMRLTTTHARLHVIVLLGRGTADERVYARLRDKADVARALSRSEALRLLN